MVGVVVGDRLLPRSRASHSTVENRPGLCLLSVLSSTFGAPDTEQGRTGDSQRQQPARGDDHERGDRAGVANTLRGLASSPEAQVRLRAWAVCPLFEIAQF